MKVRGERLFRFLAALMVDRFYGSVTIKFEVGNGAAISGVAQGVKL